MSPSRLSTKKIPTLFGHFGIKAYLCNTITNKYYMKKRIGWIGMALALLILATGCTRKAPRHVIGISQCSEDIWREKQNAELRVGAYLHDDVELRFASAYDSDQRQIEQIDSLIQSGIDLLIVAPNQVKTISPAIDRAYDKGIPVIVFERKTSSQKFTAFMSADNYEMGRQMGEYIASRLHGKGCVMEIMGLKGSSPAIERHKGFADALKDYPEIYTVATLQGDWTEESGYKAISNWLLAVSQEPTADSQKPIDFVFGQNDRMAMGARRALQESQQPIAKGQQPNFCGIDGLPGEQGGIQLVRDSILDASYIYPTHGDQLLQLAVDILDGKPYQKETRLMSALVTRDNASVLYMQGEEMLRQAAYLDVLHQQSDTYLQQLGTQRTITLLAVGVIVLLLVAIILFYRYHIGQITLRRERVINTLWNMEPEKTQQTGDTGKAVETADHMDSPNAAESVDAVTASVFITRFKEVIEARLTDSEISVEDLAADMNLSRVQLYRKVKNVTGSSPVELLRTARLKRAYQLLVTTELTVSEVAYQVGFSAPSYFTKCFKDEYGQLPGDIRK